MSARSDWDVAKIGLKNGEEAIFQGYSSLDMLQRSNMAHALRLIMEKLEEDTKKATKLDELIELLKQHDNPDEIDQWILEVRETWEAWFRD